MFDVLEDIDMHIRKCVQMAVIIFTAIGVLPYQILHYTCQCQSVLQSVSHYLLSSGFDGTLQNRLERLHQYLRVNGARFSLIQTYSRGADYRLVYPKIRLAKSVKFIKVIAEKAARGDTAYIATVSPKHPPIAA
jgi:hypothetical protein